MMIYVEGIKTFVKILFDAGYTDLKLFDNFFFSFTINQISKEFDLIKISEDIERAVNIELKSKAIEIDDIKKQLVKNKYYLTSACSHVDLYTVILDEKKVYKLVEDNEIISSDLESLTDDIVRIEKPMTEGIEKVFSASQFIMSPISEPEKFLGGFYALNSKQEEVKSHIISIFKEQEVDSNLVGVEGQPGTGKSLLLYDIAQELAQVTKVLIIHCAIMSSEHKRLKINNVDIVPVRDVNASTDYTQYGLVLVDEAHRIYPNDYRNICQETEKNNIICVMFYDDMQRLQNSEISANISRHIKEASETSWLELNPGDKTKATINTELNYTEHKYLSAFFEVFNDEGYGVEEINIVDYELGEKENVEYDEPQENLAYDSATLSIFYVGPDENGIRLRAKNKRDRAVHIVLDAPYRVNEEDVGEYTNASPIPPNAISDYYVNVKEFNADYSPDSVSSFSSTGRTYDGQDIDVFSISSSKEVEPYSGEELQSNVPQAASSQEKSTVSDAASGENGEDSSSVTENTANISNRLQINEYKKNQVEKYINCFKKAGVEYNVSANGCYVVGKDTEREILDAKYRILELSCSLYSQYKNSINNGVEVQYQVHKELGLEESDPHTKLIYEFYSMAENNPVDLNTFISTVNNALDQKNEDPVLEGDTYSVYLSISRSDVVPSTVHFVSYDSVPCNLSQTEDYNYLEFDSLEEREDFIDRVESTINDNDLNVKGIIHEYANESNLKSHDNNLGIAMKFTLYASFTNGVPVEDYRDLLVKPIEAIGLDYIIDKDVTAEDIANEIISCSQIRKYSEETKMYIDYNPDYRDYNTCALREKYAFNPLRCQQYVGLTYGVCGVVMDDFDTMHLFVPAKVQGLKNK